MCIYRTTSFDSSHANLTTILTNTVDRVSNRIRNEGAIIILLPYLISKEYVTTSTLIYNITHAIFMLTMSERLEVVCTASSN